MDHSAADQISRRASVVSRHLRRPSDSSPPLSLSPCLNYSPPAGADAFDTREMRRLLDGHSVEARDWVFRMMEESPLFRPVERALGSVFVCPDYNQTMEQQREAADRRIAYLRDRGVFDGWLTDVGEEAEMRKIAIHGSIGVFDHSLAVKLAVQFSLWGCAIQCFGTKRHHDKWLKDTERYLVKGCFAMTELGHGSNVQGIETIATYDSKTGEFVIRTPCESAQKYWIGGAANNATHAVVFSQLYINGTNQGVHAFIAQIRDTDGNICPNVHIADCGHKIGLNGVDNGRIWFENLRIPRENLLNSCADVLLDGKYVTAIKDPDQRFAAFLAPLTSGRVNIAASTLYYSKVGLAIAVRYALTRRAFSVSQDDPKVGFAVAIEYPNREDPSVSQNGPELLLLDYPSHQHRLLPLVAKTCAMSSAGHFLLRLYVKRNPDMYKTVHIYSSALKATHTWHNMRTLQECREACGGQGLKTENRLGILKGETDVQSTFEGDNNILMQQVSKTLLAVYLAAQKRKKPFSGLGLEHMNNPCPVIPDNLPSFTVRSIKFQMDIFCLRERDLLNRFASEVSEHQVQGESKEKSVILSYQLAEDLARAFAERTILQAFLDDEMSLPAGRLKEVVGLLRSMYALICLEEDASFLRYGYLSLSNSAVVREEVTKLCSELRPHALSIVTSFGIPDSFLGPLAFDWIEANAWSRVSTI